MVQAWYMDDSNEDQRLPHKTEPLQPVSLEDLKEMTGVLYWKLDPQNYEESIAKISKERGYSYNDLIEVSPEKLPGYDQKIKSFFEEHIHTDEEIRYIVAGSGYFDVRDNQDKWIRIETVAGDLIILPAGIYHRFTLDSNDYIKALRLFIGQPVWTPHNRPADTMKERMDYVELQKNHFKNLVA